MDAGQLRWFVMHIAERDSKIVGEEDLKIKEDSSGQSQSQIHHPPEIIPNKAVIESKSSV
jgi:hypothetical protein